jgi:hypothetical protein
MALEALPAGAAAVRRVRRSVPPAVAYLGVILVPPALFYLGLASGQSAGTFLVCLALLACRLGGIYGADGSRSAPVLGDRAVLFVSGLVGLHVLIAATFEPVAIPRAIASLAPLGLLLLGGGALASMLFILPPRALHRALRFSFLLLCLLAILAVIGLVVPSTVGWRRPVFPFSEPSHFALAFVPLLMYVTITARGARRVAFLILGFVCTALIQNLTLAAGFALVALVTMRWYVLPLALVVVGAIAANLDLTYYAERLDFSGDSTNLSNLIYLQGWEMVGESWRRSAGFGIGFQQLGVFGTDVPAAQLLRALRDGEDINTLDGGFVFAKLSSEFGVFACALVMVFLWFAWRSLRTLRRVARERPRIGPLTILAHCVIVSYFIELFVRSTGYFTPAAVLLVAAFGVLARERWAAARTGRVAFGAAKIA